MFNYEKRYQPAYETFYNHYVVQPLPWHFQRIFSEPLEYIMWRV